MNHPLATKKDLFELRADIARWLISGILALSEIVIASIGVGVAVLAWLLPERI